MKKLIVVVIVICGLAAGAQWFLHTYSPTDKTPSQPNQTASEAGFSVVSGVDSNWVWHYADAQPLTCQSLTLDTDAVQADTSRLVAIHLVHKPSHCEQGLSEITGRIYHNMPVTFQLFVDGKQVTEISKNY